MDSRYTTVIKKSGNILRDNATKSIQISANADGEKKLYGEELLSQNSKDRNVKVTSKDFADGSQDMKTATYYTKEDIRGALLKAMDQTASRSVVFKVLDRTGKINKVKLRKGQRITTDAVNKLVSNAVSTLQLPAVENFNDDGTMTIEQYNDNANISTATVGGLENFAKAGVPTYMYNINALQMEERKNWFKSANFGQFFNSVGATSCEWIRKNGLKTAFVGTAVAVGATKGTAIGTALWGWATGMSLATLGMGALGVGAVAATYFAVSKLGKAFVKSITEARESAKARMSAEKIDAEKFARERLDSEAPERTSDAE